MAETRVDLQMFRTAVNDLLDSLYESSSPEEDDRILLMTRARDAIGDAMAGKPEAFLADQSLVTAASEALLYYDSFNKDKDPAVTEELKKLEAARAEYAARRPHGSSGVLGRSGAFTEPPTGVILSTRAAGKGFEQVLLVAAGPKAVADASIEQLIENLSKPGNFKIYSPEEIARLRETAKKYLRPGQMHNLGTYIQGLLLNRLNLTRWPTEEVTQAVMKDSRLSIHRNFLKEVMGIKNDADFKNTVTEALSASRQAAEELLRRLSAKAVRGGREPTGVRSGVVHGYLTTNNSTGRVAPSSMGGLRKATILLLRNSGRALDGKEMAAANAIERALEELYGQRLLQSEIIEIMKNPRSPYLQEIREAIDVEEDRFGEIVTRALNAKLRSLETLRGIVKEIRNSRQERPGGGRGGKGPVRGK